MVGKIWPQEGENGGKRQNMVDDISSTYTKRGVTEKESKKNGSVYTAHSNDTSPPARLQLLKVP